MIITEGWALAINVKRYNSEIKTANFDHFKQIVNFSLSNLVIINCLGGRSKKH